MVADPSASVQPPRVPRHAVLSHRARGFGLPEGSLPALKSALACRIGHVEMDTRRTADGVLLAFHDNRLEGMTTVTGRTEAYDLAASGPLRFRELPSEEVPTLEAFAACFAEHAPPDVRLHLDVKDSGTESDHVALVERLGLAERVNFVAWDPGILLRLHALRPEQRLYFSYVALAGWLSTARAVTLALEGDRLSPIARRLLGRISPRFALGSESVRIYRPNDGAGSARDIDDSIPGEFPIHLLPQLPTGEVLAAILKSGGGVNLPAASLQPRLVQAVRSHGLRLGIFSFATTRQAESAYAQYAPDLLYVDRIEDPAG